MKARHKTNKSRSGTTKPRRAIMRDVPTTVFSASYSAPAIVKTSKWHLGPMAKVIKDLAPIAPLQANAFDEHALHLQPEELDDMIVDTLRAISSNISLTSSAVEVLRSACHQRFNLVEPSVAPCPSPAESSLSDSLTPMDSWDDIEIKAEPHFMAHYPSEPSTPVEEFSSSSSSLYANETLCIEDSMQYELYPVPEESDLLMY